MDARLILSGDPRNIKITDTSIPQLGNSPNGGAQGLKDFADSIHTPKPDTDASAVIISPALVQSTGGVDGQTVLIAAVAAVLLYKFVL